MTAADEPRVWTILVPAPATWLTANRELEPLHRSRIVRAWRRAVVRACEHEDLPKGLPGPVRIQAVIQYAGERPPVRDASNLAPTIKACIDGLGPSRRVRRRDGTIGQTHGYGLLVDDSDRVIPRLPTWRLEPMPIGGGETVGRVVIRITDNSPARLFDQQL
jgi:hypothetical protein